MIIRSKGSNYSTLTTAQTPNIFSFLLALYGMITLMISFRGHFSMHINKGRNPAFQIFNSREREMIIRSKGSNYSTLITAQTPNIFSFLLAVYGIMALMISLHGPFSPRVFSQRKAK
jgi:hypothetical protein